MTTDNLTITACESHPDLLTRFSFRGAAQIARDCRSGCWVDEASG